jgi:hypothetical protein
VPDQLPALLSSTEGIDQPPNRRITEPRLVAAIRTWYERAGDRPETCESPKIDTAPNQTLRNISWWRAPADGTDENQVEGTASLAALTPTLQPREPEGKMPRVPQVSVEAYPTWTNQPTGSRLLQALVRNPPCA